MATPFSGLVSLNGLQNLNANTATATYLGVGGANVNPTTPLNVKGNASIQGSLTVTNNFTVQGTITTINSQIIESSNIIINNAGTGPGIRVTQSGAQDVAVFADEAGAILTIADSGMVTVGGTGSATLPIKLNVNGCLSASTLTGCISDTITGSNPSIAASSYSVGALNSSLTTLINSTNIKTAGGQISGNLGVNKAASGYGLDVSGNAKIGSSLWVTGALGAGKNCGGGNNLDVAGNVNIDSSLCIQTGYETPFAALHVGGTGVVQFDNALTLGYDFMMMTSAPLLIVNGYTHISGTLGVGMDPHLSAYKLDVSGNTQLGGDLRVTGASVTGSPIAFSAFLSADLTAVAVNVTKIVFNSNKYSHSCFNNTTGTFTCAVGGIYRFEGRVCSNQTKTGNASYFGCVIKRNGTIAAVTYVNKVSGQSTTASVSTLLLCYVGDTVDCYYQIENSLGITGSASAETSFMGHIL